MICDLIDRERLRSISSTAAGAVAADWDADLSSSAAVAEQAPKLPRGVTPKTTTIEARIDLDEFLAVDDRRCVVKFDAAW